jgi:hypothetical protein
LVFNISHSYVWMIFICVSFLPSFMSNHNSLQIWYLSTFSFVKKGLGKIFHMEFEHKLFSWRITIIYHCNESFKHEYIF